MLCPISASPCSSLWGLNSLTPTVSHSKSRYWWASRQQTVSTQSSQLREPTSTSSLMCECVCSFVFVCVCSVCATLWSSGAIVAEGPSRLFQYRKQWESQRFTRASQPSDVLTDPSLVFATVHAHTHPPVRACAYQRLEVRCIYSSKNFQYFSSSDLLFPSFLKSFPQRFTAENVFTLTCSKR